MPKKKKNYVNNKEFYQALVDWNGIGKPLPLPPYIVECFLEITRRIGTKRSFSGYSYLDDMKSEAIEHCLKASGKFNIKFENPFAYFSQCVHHAFLQYLKKENKLVDYKFREVREKMDNAHKVDRDSITGYNRNKNGDVVDEFGKILTPVEELKAKGCY